MEKRIAVIAIVIEKREKSAKVVNEILSDYGNIIVGRMGLPHNERDVSVISLIIDATSDEIGSITGKLGNISGVKVKSVMVY